MSNFNVTETQTQRKQMFQDLLRAALMLAFAVSYVLLVLCDRVTLHRMNTLEAQVHVLKDNLKAAQVEILDLEDQLQKLTWISQDIDRRLIDRGL